ncbi:uncharacterized protein [Halyomorpha halys]|uniref:uncharacterized protein n=1 Tax=Halyomorpha halys TaxID=286706 RepID=UPI0006D4D68A
MFRLLFLAALVFGQCPDGRELTFAKIAGFSPALSTPPPLLYAASYGAAITAECYNRCRSSTDCLGFVVDYAKSSCHRVPNIPGYQEAIKSDPAVNYFYKLCLKLPDDCPQRAWSLEVTPGFELVGSLDNVIPNVKDKWHCSQLCIENNESAPCLSVNYHPSTGRCALSSRSKWTDPESFIPTVHEDSFYIENHCADSEGNKCWHEPVINQTSIRSDLVTGNITLDECKDKCQNETYFRCRAFSFLNKQHQCLLHSDTAHFSPVILPSLTPTQDAIYVEAIPCVNLTVDCDETSLTVTLNSPKFEGMLYAQGHSDTCFVQGRGQNITVLKMSLSANDTAKCNAHLAFSVGKINRTMASAVIVVQKHQLIQTASDSIIKVNCYLPRKEVKDNLTLTTGFSVLEPGIQTEITGSSIEHEGAIGKAKAKISVIDPKTGKEPKEIQLGDPILLKIEVSPPYNSSMVRAGHLIASSGTHTDSLLLLDSRGCPPSVSLFPPLTIAGPQTLSAEFKAFRFPSSPVLALSLVLTFCPTICKPADCGNEIISYGRKKRSATALSGFQEVPLQLAIVVHSDYSEPNPTNLLQASLGSIDDKTEKSREICTSFLTAALIGLFWILLQCCLLAVGCVVVHRRQKEFSDTISLRHDFQPRHVTWSDETDIPSKNLRLTTPVRT